MEATKKYQKKYYQEHRDYYKLKKECPICNKMICRTHMATHKKTKAHRDKEIALGVVNKIRSGEVIEGKEKMISLFEGVLKLLKA